MFLYYLRLAAKSVRATPGLSLLTVGRDRARRRDPDRAPVGSPGGRPGSDPRQERPPLQRPGRQLGPGERVLRRQAGRPAEAHRLPRHARPDGDRPPPPPHRSRRARALFVFPESETIRPYPAIVQLCHADFFPMFDVPFRHGGGWSRAADERQERVVVLSEDANRSSSAAPTASARRSAWARRAYTVVGVLDRYQPIPAVLRRDQQRDGRRARLLRAVRHDPRRGHRPHADRRHRRLGAVSAQRLPGGARQRRVQLDPVLGGARSRPRRRLRDFVDDYARLAEGARAFPEAAQQPGDAAHGMDARARRRAARGQRAGRASRSSS